MTALVVLNEIYPNPLGADESQEFIELYNPGEIAVDLSSWKIDDLEDGGSKAYLFPEGTVLAAKNFLVIGKNQSKITLNNNGDEVVLRDKTGNLIDEFVYEESQEEVSLGRYPDGSGRWGELLEKSPAVANKIVLPSLTPKPSVTSRPTLTPTPTRLPPSSSPTMISYAVVTDLPSQPTPATNFPTPLIAQVQEAVAVESEAMIPEKTFFWPAFSLAAVFFLLSVILAIIIARKQTNLMQI